jgi:hypothetical protein
MIEIATVRIRTRGGECCEATRRRAMTGIALTGLVLSVAAPAAAGPNALGCFTRTYDRAHLARHPDQLITALKLHIHKPPPRT